MNYCGSPIYCPDVRFLEQYETVNSKPMDIGYVETNYKYNPDNDVDISLGIRPYTDNTIVNNTFTKSNWWIFW